MRAGPGGAAGRRRARSAGPRRPRRSAGRSPPAAARRVPDPRTGRAPRRAGAGRRSGPGRPGRGTRSAPSARTADGFSRASQGPAAVAQAVERRELVRELGGERAAPERPHVHGVAPGRRARHLEHREGDVETAAQEHVPVGALQLAVARRLPVLDEPVLEYERAQLRVGGPVVHDLGALGPARGGAEVRPGARAERYRLPHVERTAAVVAKDVHPRVVGEGGEVGPLGGRDPGPRLRLALPPARAEQLERLADGDGVRAEAREQRAEHASARERVGQRAVHLLHLDPEGVRERGEPPPPRQRREAAGELDRAEHRRARPVEAGALEAWRSTRRSKPALCATSTRPRSSSATSGRTSAGAGAASTIAWVIPVKRWIPRASGRSGRTSESKVSWSSPPPTSTAPTSVSSHSSPPRPLVSVSSATNSAPATGCSSISTEPMQSKPADGWTAALQGEVVHPRA